jgi:hypothetical protein
MTINKNYLIQESDLNRMVGLAFRGRHENPDYMDSAIGVLNKCGFSEEQSAKIASILGNVPSDNAIQATTAMKERILAVLSGQDKVVDVVPEKQVACESASQIVLMKKECVINFSTMEMCSFLNEHITTFFFECQSKNEWESIGAMACVSKQFYLRAEAYWKQFDIKLFCPELTILNAKTCGITIDEEPLFSKLAILKCFKKVSPHVENNEGVTLLTMTKGITLNQLVDIGREAGMIVNVDDGVLLALGDVPVGQTYVILIINGLFLESRNKDYPVLRDKLVVGHGCELPTVQEQFALCVFTYKIFQKCLLQGPDLVGFGYCSTYFGNLPLVVGTSVDGEVIVEPNHWDGHPYGAGGLKKF